MEHSKMANMMGNRGRRSLDCGELLPISEVPVPGEGDRRRLRRRRRRREFSTSLAAAVGLRARGADKGVVERCGSGRAKRNSARKMERYVRPAKDTSRVSAMIMTPG